PHDVVISLMTLMENGAAIESATIGREGAVGLMSVLAPKQAVSRAIVQVGGRASRIGSHYLREMWDRNAGLRRVVDRHGTAPFAATTSASCRRRSASGPDRGQRAHLGHAVLTRGGNRRAVANGRGEGGELEAIGRFAGEGLGALAVRGAHRQPVSVLRQQR